MVEAFTGRIEHILAANGADFDGKANPGHAQTHQDEQVQAVAPPETARGAEAWPEMAISPPG